MQKSALITLGVITFVLLLAGVLTYYLSKTPNDVANSDASKTLLAEEGVFTTMEGDPISFADYEGKIRVVNSWASWSPYSVQELQDLNALAKKYGESGVVVVGINRKESKEVAERFLRTLPALDDIRIVLDPGDMYFERMEGFAMPETVIYDQKGNIFFHKRGPMTQSELEEKISQLLTATN